MDDNPELPDSWAVPDDLAKQVSEVLNRKSITPEDELQDALDEMARDIAMFEHPCARLGKLVDLPD